MSRFEEALKVNNLGTRIEEQYGKWGHFTEENVTTIIEIARTEAGLGKFNPIELMAMTAFTWVNESSWAFNPEPNTNNKRWSPWNWDVGPFQLNVQWTMRMAWQGDFRSRDLPFKDVFGPTFYTTDGVTPIAFPGNVVSNGRCALRRMIFDNREPGKFGFPDRQTMQVVLYTGPKAQQQRQKNWNKYGQDFKHFFEVYTSK